ncbi:MAG: glycosyl hydrolase [Ferruginibacter sp.]|nr:glycosyl hydrolase [Cytophagales bacterium]
MNRPKFVYCLLLLLSISVLPAATQHREPGTPAGAAEPEALKIRYEGNSRVPSAFQPAAVGPSTVEELNAAAAKRRQMAETSIFKHYPVRSIGPTVMSGRVVDLAVNEQNPKIFYVGYASGGVFKTVNNGNRFEPVFDHQRALSIGDLALAPSNPEVLWVGTGENNSSRSSYAGAGVYKSIDAGKSWQFAGLDFTHHVGRIVIHPQNPETVWVAGIGALYSKGQDRGVYKTTDGGKTWKQTLFVNDSTGVIDLVINPQNPRQLWAASWQRLRNAGHFVGNGAGSAIHVSDDGGETWRKSVNGFPQGRFVGRIGLDICLSKPNVLYAVVDNQEETRKPKKEEAAEKGRLQKAQFKDMTPAALVNLPNADLDTFLVKNNFPKKYTAQRVKEEIRKGRYTPQALLNYFDDDSDANANLFSTQIKGAEIYRSDDYGKTWRKVNAQPLDGLYYTYGYYFGQVRVSPTNPDQVFTWGVPLLVSNDGAKTFTLTDTLGRVHSDHHAMWINPKDPAHILNGNDGGVNLTYDGGSSWSHLNTPSVGQFYSVMVDLEKPYNVYGGLQDNGVYYGSSRSVPNQSQDWDRLMGGDGMLVAVDPRNSNLTYAGFQYGNYFRVNKGKANGRTQPVLITPKHDIGEPALRFNWRTPVVLSRHNPDILYFGSQRLHRSLNGAETWQTISPDLTKNKKQGNVPYSTLTVIAESPLTFGLLYAGTDDGNVQLTRDGGATWQLVSGGLPPDLWVSSLAPSGHDEGTIYATLNGYRYDDFKSYVYKSTDYGKTWSSLKADLPEECANVIVEDPVNSDLLYLGTDHGTYVTLDGAHTWNLLAGGLPNVANYDMIVHPRDHELVIATHGRSMYVVDVKPLQALKNGKVSDPLVAFEPGPVRHDKKWGAQEHAFVPVENPALSLPYYVGQASGGPVRAEIVDGTGKTIRQLEGSGTAGFGAVKWDLKGKAPAEKGKKGDLKESYVKPGTYGVKFTSGAATAETKVVVR